MQAGNCVLDVIGSESHFRGGHEGLFGPRRRGAIRYLPHEETCLILEVGLAFDGDGDYQVAKKTKKIELQPKPT